MDPYGLDLDPIGWQPPIKERFWPKKRFDKDQVTTKPGQAL